MITCQYISLAHYGSQQVWEAFPPLVVLFYFFFRDMKFLSYISFGCLFTVRPRYFLLFVTTVKGNASLISLSTYLSCVQRKATDSFELILYPDTLLKLLISFWISLVEFLGSLNYTIISSANSDSLTSTFLLCIPLTYFGCLIALARNSSTIMNRYDERVHPSLVPDFSGIASSFSSFSLLLPTHLLYITFTMFANGP